MIIYLEFLQDEQFTYVRWRQIFVHAFKVNLKLLFFFKHMNLIRHFLKLNPYHLKLVKIN